MSREFIFCALVAVCIVQMIKVACLPDGSIEHLVKPGPIPHVQTMAVVKTQELLGTTSARGKRMINTQPPSVDDDSTVVKQRVMETYKDDFKSTPTTPLQGYQDGSVAVGMELLDGISGLRMDQTPASLMLQAMATKDPAKVQTKESSDVERNAPVIVETTAATNVHTNVPFTVERNKSMNAETKDSVSLVKFEEPQLKVKTESPPRENHDSRHVTNKKMPRHEAGRGFLYGKESGVRLEGINIPQLIGFDANTGNTMFDNKLAEPAFGDRDIKWIIKIQQVVFDGGENENRPSLKITNRKPRLGEYVDKHMTDGQDLFREIFFPSGKRRHLLEFSDKDSADGGSALKEPDKDKGSLDSDTSAAAGGGDASGEASTGRLSLDSPNTQSMILKAFKSVPDTGEAPAGQYQPAATSYGNTDMAYPSREDLQDDSDGPPSVKLPVDFFSKEKLGTGMEEAMARLKHNYLIDLLKNRNFGNQQLDYGNKNEDGDNDDEDINELIKGSEEDQRSLKSFQAAKLAKRSAQDMRGIFGESANDDNDGYPTGSQDTRLYKRSVQDMPGYFGEHVSDGYQGLPQDSQDTRLFKRSVLGVSGDSDGSVNDNEEFPTDPQRVRLYKRSARDMPRDSGESVNDENVGSPKHAQDVRLFKRSVQGTVGDFSESVNDEEGAQRDPQDTRIYKRSVRDVPDVSADDDIQGSSTGSQDGRLYKRSARDVPDVSADDDDIQGSSTGSQDGRLYKRSARDVPGDSVNDGSEESPNDSQDFRLFKRSVQDIPADFSESVNDDNHASPKDTQDSRLFKRSVQDIPADFSESVNDDNDASPKDTQDSRLFKRSVQDIPADFSESVNDDNDASPKDTQDSRLYKRSVQDIPFDSDVLSNGDNERSPAHSQDGRLYKRSVPGMSVGIGGFVNDENDGPRKETQDGRLYKRSVPGMARGIGGFVNDKNDGSRKETQDGRLYKRSVQDVSGKYGVAVNDDNDGSPKEYDIEVENGVKEVRFPADDTSAVVKREVSSIVHPHNSPARGYQRRNSSAWIDGGVKETRSSDNNKVQHGENDGKMFVSGDGSPTLVGLVLIPVNSDGTISEEKDSESTNGVQYHHLANHHRRPCNVSHGHQSSSHSTDNNGAEGKMHPCHHGHRKGHHGRHRTTEHHVVGRTDSQPAQNYGPEHHRSQEQHPDSHSEKHATNKHHPHHKGDYERPYSESSEGFSNHESEGPPPKGHHVDHGSNQPGRRRDEMIVESFRTEQITLGHAQRSTHAGNAVHVLVILSILLICFTVILFLVVRSRSGGHVREINSRTALYVPQAKY